MTIESSVKIDTKLTQTVVLLLEFGIRVVSTICEFGSISEACVNFMSMGKSKTGFLTQFVSYQRSMKRQFCFVSNLCQSPLKRAYKALWLQELQLTTFVSITLNPLKGVILETPLGRY